MTPLPKMPILVFDGGVTAEFGSGLWDKQPHRSLRPLEPETGHFLGWRLDVLHLEAE